MQSLDEVRTVRLMGLNMDGPAAYLWALGRCHIKRSLFVVESAPTYMEERFHERT